MAEDVWHLRKVRWIASLAPEAAERVRRAATSRIYAPKQMIFSPQREPDSVYALEEGLVRIFRTSPSGEEFTLGHVRPGEVFGELSALGDKPRESFAEAARRSKVWRIPKGIFLEVVRANPAALYEVTSDVGGRLGKIQTRISDLAFRSVRGRIARLLLQLAEDFGVPQGEWRSIDLPLTQVDLAALVATSRQSVSSVLRELADEGLIAREGRRILVLRSGELARVAEERERAGGGARATAP